MADGEVPMDWRSANVTAIFREDDRFKAGNYRPVSLTSLCCKLQEHIIVNTMKHIMHNKILTACHHGFRARRSCETQLVTLCHELADSLDKNKQTDLVILDLSKAFDQVPHQRLLIKLRHYGIQDTTFQWIHKAQCWVHCFSYYSLTTYQPVLNPRQDYLPMTVSYIEM